jgi:hypothetical protein
LAAPAKIPRFFFGVTVGLPVAIILFLTLATSVKFHSLPLKFAQAEINATVALTKRIAPRRSTTPVRAVPTPPAPLQVIASNPQQSESAKAALESTPVPPPVLYIETFRARVICDPEFVHTRAWTTDPDKPENRVDMRVESIDTNDVDTILHVTVNIHEGDEFGLLQAASWAYMTDNNGNRYDIAKDDDKGYPHSGYRELKYGEIARLNLAFPKFEKLPKFVYFSHPQFLLKVTTAWVRTRVRTDRTPSQ